MQLASALVTLLLVAAEQDSGSMLQNSVFSKRMSAVADVNDLNEGSMLQQRNSVFSHGEADNRHGEADVEDDSLNEPCVAWNMSLSVVENPLVNVPGTSHSLVKNYSHPEHKEQAWLYKKGDDCWMTFHGTVPDVRWISRHNWIRKWNVSGLHEGVAEKLEGIVETMNFTEIHGLCPGKFSVTGISLGGALAQMFAVVLTNKQTKLQTNLTLDKLYTFGAHSVMATSARNDQSVDGCFDGGQYWQVQNLCGTSLMDAGAVGAQIKGADVREPVRSRKVFALASRHIEYPCGVLVPDRKQNNAFMVGEMEANSNALNGCAKELWMDCGTTMAP